jgi:hypothetical protein
VALMVDARFPVDWLLDRRIQQLSDADHRAFVNALVWSVANRTDGWVGRVDLPLIPRMSDSGPDAFVAAALWAVADETGWLIVDFERTQTSRAEHETLERARRKEREKKARQRAKVAQQEPGPVPGDSPGGSPGGSVPGTAQAGRQAGRQASSNVSTNEKEQNMPRPEEQERKTEPKKNGAAPTPISTAAGLQDALWGDQ